MSARVVFIGILAFLGAAFLAIIFGIYIYYKRADKTGKSIWNEVVNEQSNTSKMSISELMVYVSDIVVAGIFGIQIMKQAGSGFAPLAKCILLPPVMALFNARKRTGKSIFLLTVAVISAFWLFFAYIIVGIPVKAPVFQIDNMKITMAHTTAKDLIDDGFDIYVKQNRSDYRVKYDELVSSGEFKKYKVDRSVSVKKGFHKELTGVSEAPYLLAKDGLIICGVWFYGDKEKDIVLEDCKIVHIRLDEECVAAAKRNSVIYRLNGVNLLAPLKLDEFKRTFNKKLWLIPHNPKDITQLHYGIQWSSGSDHLFWNEYYSYIDYDWDNNMTSFEISSEIARDKTK